LVALGLVLGSASEERVSRDEAAPSFEKVAFRAAKDLKEAI